MVLLTSRPSIELHRALSIMSEYKGRWAVAGGWAIDLFLGRETRPHDDIDLAVIRAEQGLLHAFLAGADARVAESGVLRPWARREELRRPLHEVHATWPSGETLEFLLNDVDAAGTMWLYRRDARVRRSLDRVIAVRDGIPYLAPEVVLLYKSKGHRSQDDADFDVVSPHMSSDARAWLAEAMRLADASHPWLAVLV